MMELTLTYIFSHSFLDIEILFEICGRVVVDLLTIHESLFTETRSRKTRAKLTRCKTIIKIENISHP